MVRTMKSLRTSGLQDNKNKNVFKSKYEVL